MLKAELEFLRMGGYCHTSQVAWSPEFMFRDSSTWSEPRSRAASQTVQRLRDDSAHSAEFARRKKTCRFIPRMSAETLDSLYRSGTREQIEPAMAEWLKKTIAGLELEREEWAREVHVQAKFVNRI